MAQMMADAPVAPARAYPEPGGDAGRQHGPPQGVPRPHRERALRAGAAQPALLHLPPLAQYVPLGPARPCPARRVRLPGSEPVQPYYLFNTHLNQPTNEPPRLQGGPAPPRHAPDLPPAPGAVAPGGQLRPPAPPLHRPQHPGLHRHGAGHGGRQEARPAAGPLRARHLPLRVHAHVRGCVPSHACTCTPRIKPPTNTHPILPSFL